ncbi:MAG: hypothetical protein RLZZ381_3173 [Cyanobacteriota bacterium]|jgi:hypothetical protein
MSLGFCNDEYGIIFLIRHLSQRLLISLAPDMTNIIENTLPTIEI